MANIYTLFNFIHYPYYMKVEEFVNKNFKIVIIITIILSFIISIIYVKNSSWDFWISFLNKETVIDAWTVKSIMEQIQEEGLSPDEVTPPFDSMKSQYSWSLFVMQDNTCDLLYSWDYTELIIRENFNTPSLETLKSTNWYLEYSKKFNIPKWIKNAWLCIESDFNEIWNTKRNYATTYFFVGDKEHGGHINVSYSDEYQTLYGDWRFWPDSSSRYPKWPKVYFENMDKIKVYNSFLGNHSSLGNIVVSPIEILKKWWNIRIGWFVDSKYEWWVIKVFKIFYK